MTKLILLLSYHLLGNRFILGEIKIINYTLMMNILVVDTQKYTELGKIM